MRYRTVAWLAAGLLAGVVLLVAALETYDPGRVDFGLTDQLKPRRNLLDLIKELLAALQRRLEAARLQAEPSAPPRAPTPASPAR